VRSWSLAAGRNRRSRRADHERDRDGAASGCLGPPACAGYRGDVARRRADLARRLSRAPGVRQCVVVLVKHVPERGGRLRRVSRMASRARLPRDQRRGHARRGARLSPGARVDVALDSGSSAWPRPYARRRLPTARDRGRRRGAGRDEPRGSRRRRYVGVARRTAAV